MILGICGKIAAGKTALAQRILTEESVVIGHTRVAIPNPQILEVDHLAHDLFLQPDIIARIASEFGSGVINNGHVDRGELSKIVFGDAERLVALERILHPLMRRLVEARVSDARKSNINLLLVAALPRSFGFAEHCAEIISLPIDKQSALERVRLRNPQVSLAQFEMIWQRQATEYPCPKLKKK